MLRKAQFCADSRWQLFYSRMGPWQPVGRAPPGLGPQAGRWSHCSWEGEPRPHSRAHAHAFPCLVFHWLPQLRRFDVTGVHRNSITALAWSPNGMKLFSGDDRGKIVCSFLDLDQVTWLAGSLPLPRSHGGRACVSGGLCGWSAWLLFISFFFFFF